MEATLVSKVGWKNSHTVSPPTANPFSDVVLTWWIENSHSSLDFHTTNLFLFFFFFFVVSSVKRKRRDARDDGRARRERRRERDLVRAGRTSVRTRRGLGRGQLRVLRLPGGSCIDDVATWGGQKKKKKCRKTLLEDMTTHWMNKQPEG